MSLLPTWRGAAGSVALRGALVTLLAAAPAAAQPVARDGVAGSASMPSRGVLLEDVERSRQNVLKYLDAAPDSMLGFRPTPGVRTFAQQIEHAAGANDFILAGAWKVQSGLARPDTAAIYRDKSALRTYVNQAYDEFARLVRSADDARLTRDGTFARTTKTGWRWVATALEHATWTLGQTVSYLRANGVTPPQFLPF